MRVVCPFTFDHLHPATVAALASYAPQAVFRDVSGSNEAYWQLLHDLWADSTEPLVLVEHDIEIHANVLPSFDRCPEPYCVHPFPGPGFAHDGDPLLYRSLGCVRFSARLLADQPAAVDRIGEISDGLPLRDWRRVDTLLASELERAGYWAHAHWPAVVHHHRYDTGPACGGCAACVGV